MFDLIAVVTRCFAIVTIIGFYFLPTLIALAMNSVYILPILILNIFAGWTGIGWIGALIWAVIK